MRLLCNRATEGLFSPCPPAPGVKCRWVALPPWWPPGCWGHASAALTLPGTPWTCPATTPPSRCWVSSCSGLAGEPSACSCPSWVWFARLWFGRQLNGQTRPIPFVGCNPVGSFPAVVGLVCQPPFLSTCLVLVVREGVLCCGNLPSLLWLVSGAPMAMQPVHVSFRQQYQMMVRH